MRSYKNLSSGKYNLAPPSPLIGLIIFCLYALDFLPVNQLRGAFKVIPLSNEPSPKVEKGTSVNVAKAPISQPLLKDLNLQPGTCQHPT